MMMLDLPEDAWRHVALYLFAPDVLSFLSVHRLIHHNLGTSKVLWKLLLERDSYCLQNHNNGLPTVSVQEQSAAATAATAAAAAAATAVLPTVASAGTSTVLNATAVMDPTASMSVQELRLLYMTKAYVNHLPAVRWYPIRNGCQSGVSPREGHLACVLGSGPNRKICINGGFTDDDAVYVLRAPTTTTTTTTVSSSSSASIPTPWTWDRIIPHIGEGMVGFVYGSSLTAIDDTRAVRFGGFRAGGYSHETNQVALLTVTETECTMDSRNKMLEASYEVIPTTHATMGAARAYHSATLVAGRYLVVVGGMMWRGSFLNEAILDTHTWTWLEHDIAMGGKPSGRHGHSVVVDERRNRLVLFGGGNGSNLLRSGVDNSEVWELQMGDDWKTNLPASLPWKWRQLHMDIVNPTRPERRTASGNDSRMSDDDSAAYAMAVAITATSLPLSRAEALCLGRCHNAVRVSPDTVLFVLGSGRPSTNAVLAYDLPSDQFVRPRVRGPLPKPRHSGVAAYLEEEGYLLVHGGYTVRDGDAIGDMSILDLAPDAHQRPTFDLLPLDLNYQSYQVVTDEDAVGDGYRGRQMMDVGMLFSMLNQPGQQDIARTLMMNGGDMGGDLTERSMLLMNLFATGGEAAEAAMAAVAAAGAGNQSDSEDVDWDDDEEENEDDVDGDGDGDDGDEEMDMDDSDYHPHEE